MQKTFQLRSVSSVPRLDSSGIRVPTVDGVWRIVPYFSV